MTMTTSTRTSSFKKLRTTTAPPAIVSKDSSEENYWRKFQYPVTVKEHAAISCVDFSPTEPHDFAVTSATRVQVYSSATNQVKRSITRFRETVYSAKFRHDGQLLAGGGEEGIVKVFNLTSRAILRQCEGHTKAIRQTCFTTCGLKILSTADDRTLRSWDLTTGEALQEFTGHEDYVRALAVSPGSSDVCVTGSYDHTVRLWDMRSSPSSGASLTMNHGFPVEAVLMFPSASICVSAGHNQVCVWDILSGGRQLFSFSNHQKTITSLAFDGEARRLMSGGADRQLKVYDVTDYSVIHGLSYPSPIFSIGLSPNESHLVVGMADGTLSIKRKVVKGGEDTEEKDGPTLPKPPPHVGTKRFFNRSKTQPEEGDVVVNQSRTMYQLKPYEVQLKKFRYMDALDAAMKTGNCDVIAGMFQELIHRDGLSNSLAGRNHKSLIPIMKFLVHYIGHPRYQSLLLDVANAVLDMYGGVCGESRRITQQLNALRSRVEAEINMQRRMLSILGMMDTLFAMASTKQQ
ncbi:U3 small nucleolar RNA-associated protein 15 homolog [Sycon ciliatum]|uniref:U3 small nucleolar RNA-associated protein 15 homolog n=1 Tax=Sycon ciliatum TaxID=27933 RepID=UPI0020AD3731|eukprot:scpid59483/ scgid16049/ U3 small nucleolar RNA-associated protein 15 homolog